MVIKCQSKTWFHERHVTDLVFVSILFILISWNAIHVDGSDLFRASLERRTRSLQFGGNAPRRPDQKSRIQSTTTEPNQPSRSEDEEPDFTIIPPSTPATTTVASRRRPAGTRRTVRTTTTTTPQPEMSSEEKLDLKGSRCYRAEYDCVCVNSMFCNEEDVVNPGDGDGLIDERRGESEMCEEEGQVCCVATAKSAVLAKKPGSPARLINPDESLVGGDEEEVCGKRHKCGLDRRIARPDREMEADFGEWPWHIMILEEVRTANNRLRYKFVCSGAIINRKAILSMGHCFDGKPPERLKNMVVRVGEYNVSNTREVLFHNQIKIARIFIHPQRVPKTVENDLAIVELSKEIEYQPHISPICLPPSHLTAADFQGLTCVGTGWGRGGKKNVDGKIHSPVLQEIRMPLMQYHDCNKYMTEHGLGPSTGLHPGLLCGGGPKEYHANSNSIHYDDHVDICQRLGCGLLSCLYEGSWVLRGITGSLYGCDLQQYPFMFTNVAYYRNWIDSVISQIEGPVAPV